MANSQEFQSLLEECKNLPFGKNFVQAVKLATGMTLPNGTINVGYISDIGSSFDMPEDKVERICQILKEGGIK